MSEILKLEWAWVDLDNRRVEWPDSKTGGMSKPMSAEAVRLLEAAPRLEKSLYVCPSIFDPNWPMSKHTYYKGWRRILGRAGLPRIGTHGIRHRSATDIANPGIPVKVGMALTAHKTVTMFMRYVHVQALDVLDVQHRRDVDGGAKDCGRVPGADVTSCPITLAVPAPRIPGKVDHRRCYTNQGAESLGIWSLQTFVSDFWRPPSRWCASGVSPS